MSYAGTALALGTDLVADISFELGAELLSWEDPNPEVLSMRLERLQLEAWEALYFAHRSLVRGVLAGCFGYSRELESVTDSVFVVALNCVASKSTAVPKDDSALRPWLVSVAVQVCMLEQNQRRLITASSAPDLDPESSQLLQHAHALLSKMPLRMRLPWILWHLEKMSVADIATATKVSACTVKTRLAQADTRFRRMAQRDPILRLCLD
jgi:DNA-directed RNA polymerase specialized sigma24 family protein